MKGTVLKIELSDFGTFKSFVFTPQPHLNVIAGPNGSGKSSIVNALCLGLGGKAKSIGKSPNIADFVRYGCDEARIQIHLQGDGEDVKIITRQFTYDNRNEWKINNEPCARRVVDDLLKSMNIQVDNLCQFLAQDRVQDFVKLNPQGLLDCTEQAVGSQKMYKAHMELKDMSKSVAEDKKSLDKVEAEKKRQEERLSQIKVDVDNFNEKLKLEKDIEELERKNVYMKTLVEMNEAEKDQRVVEKKKSQVDAAKKELQPLQEQIDAFRRVVDTKTKRYQEMGKAYNQETGKVQRKMSELEGFNDDINRNQRAAERYLKLKEEQNQKIHTTENTIKITNLQVQTLESVPNENRIKEEQEIVKKINEESRRRDEALNGIDAAKAQLDIHNHEISRIDSELKLIDNVDEQAFQALRQNNERAYRATCWLRKNRHRFRGQVYEPMILLIKPRSMADAKYIEDHIARRDFLAFTFEDKQDMRDFVRLLKEEENVTVSAVLSQNTGEPIPSMDITNYRKYGFHCFLKDLFTAPETIVRYLCNQYRVHQIPVGGPQVSDHKDAIVYTEKIRKFYAEDYCVTSKQSRYSSNLSTTITNVFDKGLLSVGVDMVKKNQLKHMMTQNEMKRKVSEQLVSSMGDKLNNIQMIINNLKSERTKMREQNAKKDTYMRRIANFKRELEGLKEEEKNIEHERVEALQKNKELAQNYVTAVALLHQHLASLNGAWLDLRVLEEEVGAAEMYLSNREKDFESHSFALRRLEEELKEAVAAYRGKQRALQALKTEAENKIKFSMDARIPPAVNKIWEKLPNSMEAVQSLIHEYQNKVDNMYHVDRQVVDTYKKCNEELSRLESKYRELKNRMETSDKRAEDLEKEWLPELHTIVKRVCEKFGKYFDTLGCVGEVLLKHGEKKEDYSMYGLQIRVKFRDNEEMQDLNALHQSGGERAVSTAVYMMALQELTHTPFRCLDEINQGMDTTNERRIFDLLFSITNTKLPCQYFLLTPKLIDGQEYSRNTAVHILHHGPALYVNETVNAAEDLAILKH